MSEIINEEVTEQKDDSSEVLVVGLDLGNKNLKICGEEGSSHEISMHYTPISKSIYDYEGTGAGRVKVKYKDQMCFAGANCELSVQENKGDESIRPISNMFKLIGLALELKRRGLTKGKFKVMTGTPAADFETYQQGYLDLMLSDGPETIIMDDQEYTIEVIAAKVTRQAACVAPSIRGWREIDFVLLDFGGGTLDGAYFVKGSKVGDYQTVEFSLNKLMHDLGYYLRENGLGLPRPSIHDSRFLGVMEGLVETGLYADRETITMTLDDEIKDISIKEVIDKWLQDRVTPVLEEMRRNFGLSTDDTNSTKAFHMGGGAKTLKRQLDKNSVFKDNEVLENPHFINVEVYFQMANILEW